MEFSGAMNFAKLMVMVLLAQVLSAQLWCAEAGVITKRRSSSWVGESSMDDVPIVYAEQFITEAQTQYGAEIEAASVDDSGCIFATDYRGQRSALGQISGASGVAAQGLFVQDSSASPSLFNGLRFLPTKQVVTSVISGRALAADVKGHKVVLLSIERDRVRRVTGSVFCHDAAMVEPNDLAIAPRSGRVYTSGQLYGSDTVIGDGDLWMCETRPKFQFNVSDLPVKATRLGVFGRTNGIEVSPNEDTLYLSEAFNRNGLVSSNKIWKFSIDAWTGSLQDPSLFVDFEQLDGSGAFDVDGMRTDVDGNLFVTRCGRGEVIKFSPEGRPLLRIVLPGVRSPTNLELGGINGTSLFVVGGCARGGPGKGCIDVWHHNSAPGRAFRDLTINL